MNTRNQFRWKSSKIVHSNKQVGCSNWFANNRYWLLFVQRSFTMHINYITLKCNGIPQGLELGTTENILGSNRLSLGKWQTEQTTSVPSHAVIIVISLSLSLSTVLWQYWLQRHSGYSLWDLIKNMKFLKESMVVVHLSLQSEIVFWQDHANMLLCLNPRGHCISILKSSGEELESWLDCLQPMSSCVLCWLRKVTANRDNEHMTELKKTNQEREFLFRKTWNSDLQFNGTTQLVYS